MKYFIFLVTLSFSFFSSAAYTEMIIEGVQESNGVWTTAGVMDTQGFVRTTAQVSVYGSTKNVPVSLMADISASSKLLKLAARSAGPIALAATAIDVYDWVFNDEDIATKGSDWVYQDSNVEIFNYYWLGSYSGATPQSSSTGACNQMDSLYTGFNAPELILVNSTTYTCRLSGVAHPTDKVSSTITRKSCTTQQIASCQPQTPLTPQQFDDLLPLAPIPIIISGWNNIPSLSGQPTPITSTDFTPFSEWVSDPYFKDGNWWRDRMDVSPAPLPGQPTRVRIDVGPVKLDGQTDPNVKPDDTPASGSTAPKEQTKFCDDNPMSIACAEMGELEEEELETKEIPVNTSYSPWGSSNSNCPQPRVVNIFDGKSFSISYQPTCDFVTMLRPLLIGLALVAAAYIIGGFGRSGGGE